MRVSMCYEGGAGPCDRWTREKERERESVLVNALSRPRRSLETIVVLIQSRKNPFFSFSFPLLSSSKTSVSLDSAEVGAKVVSEKESGHSHTRDKGMLADTFVPYG